MTGEGAPITETVTTPPLWESTTLFETGFEAGERGVWDASDYSTTTTTPLEGSRAGVFGSKQYAYKRLNSTDRMYFRMAYRITAVAMAEAARDIFVIGNGVSDVISLTVWASGVIGATITCAIGEEGETAWATWTDGAVLIGVPTAWHTVEVFIDQTTKAVTVWLDGNELVSDTLETTTSVASYYTLMVGNSGVSGHTFEADCIKIDTFRAGLPGHITPLTEVYTHDVEIDGQGFNLYQNRIQEQDLSGFAPRLGTGDVSYSDLSGFQHFFVPSLHHGLGQTEMTGAGQGDVSAYATGYRIDTTGQGVIRAWNYDTPYSLVTLVDGLDDIDTRITGTSVGSTAIVGIGFPAAQASGSDVCLIKIADSSTTTTSFTTTWGVRDVLNNGAYVFATLGGARMQKAAITNLTTWSNVGNDTNPPSDMGRMAMYNGFLWVADRTTPLLYRAGESDASDLEKAAEGVIGVTRVGAGSIPINALCPYLGRLYVGRQDGLYYVTMDEGAGSVVNTEVVETFPQGAHNCRDMVVHNGYLVYAVGSRIYRFSGESKQDITPGPILPFGDPAETVRYWLSLTVVNGYLYAWVATASALHLLVYNGIGWHRMTNNSSATASAGVVGVMTASDEPRVYYTLIESATSASAGYVFRSSAFLGEDRPVDTTYAGTGWLDTPWYSMGMPSVPKLFRAVHVLTDEWPDYVESETPYIKVEYWLHTDQGDSSTAVLAGYVIQKDCGLVILPPGAIGTKIRLRLTLVHPAGKPILVRGIVIQYIDRPEPVWGYSMTLDLSHNPRTHAAEPGGEGALQLKQHLRDARAKEGYVTFRDKEGSISHGFISSGPRFSEVQGVSVAQLNFMVVKRYINTPPSSGLSVTLS